MITKWSEGDADVNMDEDILVELSRTIHRHPWWRARASLTIALLKRLGVRSVRAGARCRMWVGRDLEPSGAMRLSGRWSGYFTTRPRSTRSARPAVDRGRSRTTARRSFRTL